MRRWWVALGIFVAGSALVEILAHDESHAVFVWHGLPAFDFVYGFAGCIALALFSKGLGHRFLQREESYYEDDGE